MNTQVEQALHDILNSLQTYTQSIQGYNELAYSAATEWNQQLEAYVHWVNAANAYNAYLNSISELGRSLTTEVMVPVELNTIVGIGIPGVGVIYTTATVYPDGSTSLPMSETVQENFAPINHIGVGGLPNGTLIYTSVATYSIQDGQVTVLGQVG